MLTSKPADNDRPQPTPRTGHGAASLIPHLNHEAHRAEEQGECDPDPRSGSEAAPEGPEPAAGRSVRP